MGRRHAEFFVGLAERVAPELKGHGQVVWLGRLETEHGNLRAAMRRLLRGGDVEAAARLAWALRLFWYVRGHQSEGYRYATETLRRGGALPESVRARTLCVAASMSYGLEDTERTRELWEESAVLFRQTGNGQGLAVSLAGMGLMALQQGDVGRARALFEEVLGLYREVGDRWGVSSVLSHLGIASLRQGDHGKAAWYFGEALEISREIGDGLIGSIALYNLAPALVAAGYTAAELRRIVCDLDFRSLKDRIMKTRVPILPNIVSLLKDRVIYEGEAFHARGSPTASPRKASRPLAT